MVVKFAREPAVYASAESSKAGNAPVQPVAKKVKQAANQGKAAADAAMDEPNDEVTEDVDQAGKTGITQALARKGRPAQRAAAKDVKYTDASVNGNTGKCVAVVEVCAIFAVCACLRCAPYIWIVADSISCSLSHFGLQSPRALYMQRCTRRGAPADSASSHKFNGMLAATHMHPQCQIICARTIY